MAAIKEKVLWQTSVNLQQFSFFLFFFFNTLCGVLFFLIYLFFSLFLAALGLCCCTWAFSSCEGYSSLRCAGFLLWWLLLWSTGSRRAGFSSCGSWALEHRLSSCGAMAQLLCSMWGLPGPRIKPVSLALASGFLTTVPPGKSLQQLSFILNFFSFLPPSPNP